MYTTLYSLSLSSPPSVSSSLWEWDSCPTMKLWKYEHPPEGWLSESKVRRGRHTVVSHWIFHLNPWNIHCWGQRTRTTWAHCNNVSLFVQLERLSLALALIKWGWEGFICVCVSVRGSAALTAPPPPEVPLDDWQADVPEEPLCHVWSVTASVPRCEHLLKEPVEVCVCLYMYMVVAEGWENKWEWACRWVCMSTNEGEIKSARACVTYVFVYPCMRRLRKYKMQKGFWCNVHLSVAVLRFLCF